MSLAVSSYIFRRDADQWLVRQGASTSEPGEAQTATLAFEEVAPQHMTQTSSARAERHVVQSRSPQPQAIESPLRERLAPAEAFVVQVVAVRREADTRLLIESLRDKELPVFVRHSTLDGFYRVLVGPYPDEEAARITQRELESAGYQAFIRH
jgi:cell division septation protein DedD